MQTSLKYIAIIVACGTLIVMVVKLRSCGTSPNQSATISVPADSVFAPIVSRSYQPPSLPFSKKTIGIKLPKGITERDVKKVTTVTVRDVPHEPSKRINIIETNSGETFVEKDSSVESVIVTRVQRPLFVVGLSFGFGISIGATSENRPGVSPLAIVAILEWFGDLHAPVLVADLDGIGIGGQYRLYHDVFVGASRCWRYEGGSRVKATVAYVL